MLILLKRWIETLLLDKSETLHDNFKLVLVNKNFHHIKSKLLPVNENFYASQKSCRGKFPAALAVFTEVNVIIF